MAWTKPTREQVLQAILSLWSSIRPEADQAIGSDIYIQANTLSFLINGLYNHYNTVLKKLMPDSSTGEHLDRWLSVMGAPNGRGGYGLYHSQGASGESAIQVTCTAAPVTVNSIHQLKDNGGRIYRIDESYTFTAAGSSNLDIQAITTGSDTNIESGSELIFLNPPAGIHEEATLVVDLDGGRDSETDVEGQARLLSLLSAPSLSGNAIQWQRWIENSSVGQLEGWVWSARENYPLGYGSVDIAATRRNKTKSSRIITDAEEELITDAIEENAPVTMLVNHRLLDIDSQEQIILIVYKLIDSVSNNEKCDWDANSHRKYVTAADSDQKLIEVNTAYSAGTISSGDLIIIDGVEAVVDLEPGNAASPVSFSHSKFSVKNWVWEDTVDLANDGYGSSGFYVLSGGGLILDVYNNVADYINSLGPAKGDTAALSGKVWDDTLRRDRVIAEATLAAKGYIEEISLCTLTGGTDDISPESDLTDTVELLTYADIRVYEDKD